MIETTPVCKHFGACGGCSYQDWEYSYELQEKTNRLKEMFKIHNLADEVFLPIQFNQPYHYRSRMDFFFYDYSVCQKKKGDFRFKVKLEECHIAHELIGKYLKKINQWFKDHQNDLPFISTPANFNRRLLKYITIRKVFFNQETSITFIVNKNAELLDSWIDFLNKNLDELENILKEEESQEISFLLGRVGEKQEVSITPDFKVLRGKEHLTEYILGKSFQFHTQGFFQNNSPMLEKIVLCIQDWMTSYDIPQKRLFDLYGGCGVLGISLAKFFEEIWVVDTESLNIDYAQKNFVANQIDNGKIMAMNVKDFLDIDDYFKKPDETVFFLDPPRSGLNPKVIKRILKRNPKVMIYVSCKIEVLIEELKPLSSQYQIAKIQPFDLFPRTPHLEVLVLLIRK